VNYDRHTVASESDVKLDPVSSDFDRFSKRTKSVFGSDSGCATVSDDERCGHCVIVRSATRRGSVWLKVNS
jgi:hypothetical protein